MTFARSFPVIPNICHTTLAGMHGRRSRGSFFTHKSGSLASLTTTVACMHGCIIHADRRVRAEISGLPLPFRTEQL